MKTPFTLLLFLALVKSGVMAQTASKGQIYYVQDMTTTDIDALDKAKTVVLLPGGILEEHGPYLPTFTDGYTNLRRTKEIADIIVQRGWNALIFPLIPLGTTGGANEIGRKYNFSGTYAVRQSTLRAIFMDLGTELGEQGFKTILIIHVHGAPNHNQAIDQACDYFTDTYKGRMISLNNLRTDAIDIKNSQDFTTAADKKEDGFTPHAGMMEHSWLYYIKPEFKSRAYKEAKPITVADFQGLVTVAIANDWPGYFGSPRLASSEVGEKYWQMTTAFITRKIEQILNNTYIVNKPTKAELMSQNPDSQAANDDAKAYDRKVEAKQNAWLKSKGLN